MAISHGMPQNFNPRLREGGDAKVHKPIKISIISIHASAKEATIQDGCGRNNSDISIHASAKEATKYCYCHNLF